MKYKFFAIPARNPAAAEDELNAFCSRHRVTFIDKQLVADGADSFWSVCATWLDGEAAPSTLASPTDNRSKPAIDYKEILSQMDFSRYLELRAFRKEVAEQQNVPPYALFTNDHLATMVQQRTNSKEGLEKIPGVGKSRIEKYGDAFLHKLIELWAREPAGGADETGTHQP
jgi:superfamily II DNA helicase RecQ